MIELGPVQLNTTKIGRTMANLRDKIVPTEKELNREGADSPGVVEQVSLNFLPVVLTTVAVVAVTPYYASTKDDFFASIRGKFAYWLPHTTLLAVIYPNLLLVIAIGVCGGAALGGLNEWRKPDQIDPDDLNDPSSVGDDEYLIPVSRRTEKSEFAGYEVSLQKRYSTLCLGESGAGKSSAIKLLAAQLTYNDSTAVVAHGAEGEYAEFYDQLGLDVITVGEDRATSASWNIFEEIPEDIHPDDVEDRFRTIAATLITEEGTNSPHFPRAAQTIFAAICATLFVERDDPDHNDLMSLVKSTPAEDVKEILSNHGHQTAADLVMGRDGPSDEWTTMTNGLSRMFSRGFKSSGSFSFREYFANPSGRIVVIESPDTMDYTGSMYAAMIDEAVRQMVDVYKDRRTIAILDEIDSIGKSRKVGDAAARGRSNNAPVIVGVQTYGQLKSVYGSDVSAIYGNCQQTIGLRPADGDGAAKLQEAVGKRRETVQSESTSWSIGPKGMPMPTEGTTEREEDRYPFTTGAARNWQTGEGVVVGDDVWWLVRLGHPDEWILKLWKRRGSVSRSPRSTAETSTATADGGGDHWDNDGHR